MTSHLSLDLSLDKDSSMIDQFNKSCSEKFIKFMNLALKSQGTNMFMEVCKIIDDKQTNYKVEVNILETPPSIFWFVFEYRDYFNLLEDDLYSNGKTFKIRTAFSRLLTIKFTLNKIFDENNNNICNLSQSGGSWNNNQPLLLNKSCKLEYLVGYYGHHYMAFIKNK